MSKEGAIILGIGGDNSISGQGTFYEGVMTSGYPSDATENNVAANVAAQKYAVASLVSGPAITVGSSVSLRLTTPGYTDRYLTHTGSTVSAQVISAASSSTAKQQASWIVRTGLGNSSSTRTQLSAHRGRSTARAIPSDRGITRHATFATTTSKAT
jgi:hypothetical protein